MSELEIKLETAQSKDNVDKLGKTLDSAVKSLKKLDTQLQISNTTLSSNSESMGKVLALNAKQASQMDALSKKVEKLTEANSKLKNKHQQLDKSYQKQINFKKVTQEQNKRLSESVKTLRKDLKGESTELKKTTLQLKKVQQQTDKTARSVEKLKRNSSGQVMRGFIGSMVDANSSMKNMLNSLNQYNSTIKGAGSKTQKLGSIITSFAGSLLGNLAAQAVVTLTSAVADLGRGFITLGLEVDRAKRTIGIVTKTQEEANKQFEFAKETADRLGLAYVGVTKEYAKFLAAGKSSTLGIKEQNKVFTSFSKALAATQASAQDTELVFLALNQMISKGKVSSEELRRQLAERLPGAFQLAAKSTGFTVSEFDKLIKKGAILTDDFLPGFARVIEATFGPSAMGAATQGLQANLNQAMNSIKELGEVVLNSGVQTGIVSLAKGFTAITRSLKDLIESDYVSIFISELSDLKLRFSEFGEAGIDTKKAREEIEKLNETASKALREGDSDVAFKARLKSRITAIQLYKEELRRANEGLEKGFLKTSDGKFITNHNELLAHQLKLINSLATAENQKAKLITVGFKKAQVQNKVEQKSFKEKALAQSKLIDLTKSRVKLLDQIQQKDVKAFSNIEKVLKAEQEFNRLSKERFERDKQKGKEGGPEAPETFFKDSAQRTRAISSLLDEVSKKARSSAESFIQMKTAAGFSKAEIKALAENTKSLSDEGKSAATNLLNLTQARRALSIIQQSTAREDTLKGRINELKVYKENLNKAIASEQRSIKAVQEKKDALAKLSSAEEVDTKAIVTATKALRLEEAKLANIKTLISEKTSVEKIDQSILNLNNKIKDVEVAKVKSALEAQLQLGKSLEEARLIVSGTVDEEALATALKVKQIQLVEQEYARNIDINQQRQSTIKDLDAIIKQLQGQDGEQKRLNETIKVRAALESRIHQTNAERALQRVRELRREGKTFKEMRFDQLKALGVTEEEILDAKRKQAQVDHGRFLTGEKTKEQLSSKIALIQEESKLLNLTAQQERRWIDDVKAKHIKANEKLISQAQSFQAIWENSADTIAGRVTDSILGLKSSFSDVIQHMAREMLQLHVKQTVVKPFQNAISGLFSPNKSSLGGGPLPVPNANAVKEADMFSDNFMSSFATPLFASAPSPSIQNAPVVGNAPVKVVVNDRRSMRSAPVEVDTSNSLDGEQQIRVLIRDTVKESLGSGELDGVMNSKYGLQKSFG